MAIGRFKRLPVANPQEFAVGTDYDLAIPVYDANEAPVLAANHNAEFRLYPSAPRRWEKPWTGLEVLTKASVDEEITLTDGLATVHLTDGDLKYRSGEHWYDLRYTDTDGYVISYSSGLIHVRAEPE